MKVKSFLTDVGGADRVTKRRETLFKDASPKEDFSDPINAVAKELHPDPFEVKVSKVEDVSPTARKYTFVPTKGVLATLSKRANTFRSASRSARPSPAVPIRFARRLSKPGAKIPSLRSRSAMAGPMATSRTTSTLP
jgi:hypothetical protein